MKKILLFIYNLLVRIFSPKLPDLKSGKAIELHAAHVHMVYRTAAQKFEPEAHEEKSAVIVYSPPVTKINRTENYSPVKNLDIKPVIHVKQISREEALRKSDLEITNDDLIKYISM